MAPAIRIIGGMTPPSPIQIHPSLSDDELIGILRARRERGLGKGWTGTGDIAAWGGRSARSRRRVARDCLNRLADAGTLERRATPFGLRWRLHRRHV